MTRAALIRSQIGIESTPGTKVDATVQLPGLLQIRHAPNRVLREEYRASWGGTNVHDDLSLQSTGQYAGRCTASTLIYWLSAAIRGDPTITGGGPYVHKYVQPLTVAPIPALKTYSAYFGDSEGALCAPGTVVTRLVIEGADDAAWTIRCDLLGMGTVAGSFITALTTIPNETVKNKLTQIFLKSTWAALDVAVPAASPSVPNDAILGLHYGFTWTWESGVANDYTTGPTLNREDLHRDIPSTTLQMRLKWNSTAAAEAVNTVNLSRRFIRLRNAGTANSIIQLDGAYDPMTMDTVADQRDGTTRATWDLVAVEDSARKVEVTVTNNVAQRLMATLLHTLHCPLGLDLDLVVDLGMTQHEYVLALEAREYRALVDILNWETVMGDAVKPSLPLTDETIGALPFALVRYISSGALIGDALDDLMETRNPNLNRR